MAEEVVKPLEVIKNEIGRYNLGQEGYLIHDDPEAFSENCGSYLIAKNCVVIKVQSQRLA